MAVSSVILRDWQIRALQAKRLGMVLVPMRETKSSSHSPYVVGSKLVVRETWAQVHPVCVAPDRFSIAGRAGIPGPPGVTYRVVYKADGPIAACRYTPREYPYRAATNQLDGDEPCCWTGPQHMPAWASRYALTVGNVRPVRVRELGEDKARLCGFTKLTKDGGTTWKYGIPDRDGLPGEDDIGWHWRAWCVDPRNACMQAWTDDHGRKHPWDTAYAWAIEVAGVRLKGNKDA